MQLLFSFLLNTRKLSSRLGGQNIQSSYIFFKFHAWHSSFYPMRMETNFMNILHIKTCVTPQFVNTIKFSINMQQETLHLLPQAMRTIPSTTPIKASNIYQYSTSSIAFNFIKILCSYHIFTKIVQASSHNLLGNIKKSSHARNSSTHTNPSRVVPTRLILLPSLSP